MSLRKVVTPVLCLVLSVLGLAATSGSADASREPAEPSASTRALGIPRTYDEAEKHFEQASGPVRSLRKFQTPSRNIYCSVAAAGPKGCEINEGSIKDPAVCSGNPVSKYVGRIEFQRGRAVPVCNTDTIRTPGAKVLAYGQIAFVENTRYACVSEAIGVTCINTYRAEGFFLHRGEYVIFNAG
jgi:hypothetical protein